MSDAGQAIASHERELKKVRKVEMQVRKKELLSIRETGEELGGQGGRQHDEE